MSSKFYAYSTESNILIYKRVARYVIQHANTDTIFEYAYVMAFYCDDRFDMYIAVNMLEYINETCQEKKQVTQRDVQKIWRNFKNFKNLRLDVTTQSYLAKEHDKRKAVALKSTMVIVIYFRLTFDVVVARRLFYWCSLNFLSWHWLAQTGNDIQ